MPEIDGRSSNIVLDITLALCICALAGGYWVWDNDPIRSMARQAPPMSAANAPPLESSLNEEGTRLFNASDFTGAEALFRRAVSTNPRSALGYSNLGVALIGERRIDEAIAALQTALSIDPSFTLARSNLNWAIDLKTHPGK